MCHFFVNCSSTFYQLFYQLFINFYFFLSTLCQLFINFTNLLSTVYQLLNNCLSAVYHSHRIAPVCAECLAFKGATAGASRCRAPPPSMVAATTKDYGCIWKDKQCICANSGTYAKTSHYCWKPIEWLVKVE